ncbi:MAG: 2-phosphosulfolactate phosphatase [Gammaproteobacteria bacterium]|jgi:2-phosphosulfolactate phosphatase|nr:2-phosphosulfolactate phosphatase [Gammaproteobacteria bacterium]
MRLHSSDFVAGAASAQGVAIVIDVFRACSLIAHALAAGAERVIPVAEIELARAMKAADPRALLIGERHARKVPGFDCGNSPTEVLRENLRARTLIHTTHAGTQGLTAAFAVADRVFTGALVNLSATIAAVRALQPDEVTIVAMGHEARERCVEDDLCREALLIGLRGERFDTSDWVARLRAAPAAQKFFDPAADWAPLEDFAYCTAIDAVPFAVAMVPSEYGQGQKEQGELRAWSI